MRVKDMDGFADVIIDTIAKVVEGPKVTGRIAELEKQIEYLQKTLGLAGKQIEDQQSAINLLILDRGRELVEKP